MMSSSPPSPTSTGSTTAASTARSNPGRFTIGKLNAAYLGVSKAGKDTPDLILAGADLYAAHEALVLPSLRLTDTKLARAGFDNIAFKKARQVYTDSSAIAAVGDMYLLNSTYIQLTRATRPDSPIAKSIEKRGEGPHHVGYRVANCQEAFDAMIAAGAVPLDAALRPGSRGTTVAFFHPKSSFGTLIELVQENPGSGH